MRTCASFDRPYSSVAPTSVLILSTEVNFVEGCVKRCISDDVRTSLAGRCVVSAMAFRLGVGIRARWSWESILTWKWLSRPSSVTPYRLTPIPVLRTSWKILTHARSLRLVATYTINALLLCLRLLGDLVSPLKASEIALLPD